jgi:hypothetical protein
MHITYNSSTFHLWLFSLSKRREQNVAYVFMVPLILISLQPTHLDLQQMKAHDQLRIRNGKEHIWKLCALEKSKLSNLGGEK